MSSSSPKGKEGEGEVSTTTPFSAHLARFRHSSPSAPLAPKSKLPSPPVTPTPTRGDGQTQTQSKRKRTRSSSSSASPISKYWDGTQEEQQEAQEECKPSTTPFKKKKKPSRSFAHPSVYAEVGGLTDSLRLGLDLVICGINPGLESGRSGFHYAHPTNHFYRCLHRSGFSTSLLTPEEGQTLPDRTSPRIGLTNLVERATAEAAELSLSEQQDSVPAFLRKIIEFKPGAIAFAGMGVCEVFCKYLWALPPLPSVSVSSTTTNSKSKRRTARPKSTVGLQPYTLSYPSSPEDPTASRSIIYVWSLPSPSGLVVKYQLTEKVEEFKKLRQALLSRSSSSDDDSALSIPEGTRIDFPLESLEQRIVAAAATASVKVKSGGRGRAKEEVKMEQQEEEDGSRPRLSVRMIKVEDLKPVLPGPDDVM